MCVCDNKLIRVTNVTTQRIRLYKNIVRVAKKFNVEEAVINLYLLSPIAILRGDGGEFIVEINKHPACMILANEAIRRSNAIHPPNL